MNNSTTTIKNVLEQKSVLKVVSHIEGLSFDESCIALSDVSVLINDDLSEDSFDSHFLRAAESSLIRKIGEVKAITDGEDVDVFSMKTSLTMFVYRELMLISPSWQKLITLSDNHGYFKNDKTKSVVQFYNGCVTTHKYKCEKEYFKRLAKIALEQFRISHAK